MITPRPSSGPDPATLLERLLDNEHGHVDGADRRDRVTHVEWIEARTARSAGWPGWAPPALVARWRVTGVTSPWSHQRLAADIARDGRSVVLSTGTASGKSLAFHLPALTAVIEGAAQPEGRGSTVLYVAPTKALGGDQARALRVLDPPDVRIASYDGDTPREERDWARRHATYVLTNPDMLHHAMLPSHTRWAAFLKSLRFVIIDEAHAYRGVFGSHVAQVLRRLRRLCLHYGSDPVFILASATVADPAASASLLVGAPVEAVTDDGSPRGATAFVLWEPSFRPVRGERGAPVRRPATAEVADLLTDLVVDGVQTVAFVRSRRAAETVAATTRSQLDDVAPELSRRVAAYRGGYLPEERRELESALQERRLLAVASTNALELGIDIAGLDAVLLAGYPGTRASFWQQVGRAGRLAQGALAILVARDDPLDTYLAHHPEALFGGPVEATVLDPANPYVLTPHLAAAAAELPLRSDELDNFGPTAAAAVEVLVTRGLLRSRPTGWFWTSRERATDLADLRGSGGEPVRLVESQTGRLLGTVDAAAAPRTVHEGAVYVHQGVTHLVRRLDLDGSAAILEVAQPDYTTSAREMSDLRVLSVMSSADWGVTKLYVGDVEVTGQVMSYVRRRVGSGEFLGELPLDLPQRTLRTRAVWWSVSAGALQAAGISAATVGGALHAAEHAAIGLMPLFATCDRWDIGGLSHPLHPDTGNPTIFVHDAHPGGVGFAERGFLAAREWLIATRAAIAACLCDDGCPACVQSPKCGNGNSPLDKAGSVSLLGVLLAG